MSKKPDPRCTQVLSKKNLMSLEDVSIDIIELIQTGEDSKKVFNAILDEALETCPIKGAAIVLPAQKSGLPDEIAAQAGLFDEILFREGSSREPQAGVNGQINFGIVCMGAPLGSLVIQTDSALSQDSIKHLKLLAYHAAICFEKQRTATTVQSLLDRLEVLNELNQLIASNASLERLVKSLVRESAFRFSADLTLAFLLDETKTILLPKGAYGCTVNQLPANTRSDQGLFAQVLRVGGQISVPNISNHPNHAMEFLCNLGIQSAEICCLEVRGDTLGILINGFRRESFSSQEELTRFAEFSQGAAVAIANAYSQERIIQYNTKLEELVNIRTRDLEIATNKAEDANQAKSKFLANMSHELRTPLTAIVGYSSVLSEGIFGALNDKQNDALQAICKSSDHLKNLINDVLNLARIESGKEEAEASEVSVKEAISHAIKLIQQTAINKGINIQPVKFDPSVSEVKMLVDSKHINQILINLLSNAVKYTPQGGKVWIDLSLISDKVRIEICDSGVGISAKKKASLFERFERGEDNYSRNQEGTGIGLNLTKHLVELNGGGIGVESEEGKGSRFWIMMPLAAEQKNNVTLSQTNSSKNKLRLDGLSALVVEDNQDTCEVLKQILLAAGASVNTASSVKEGIASLEGHSPDIILTDLAMPGETGISLINHVRKGDDSNKDLPIIVLSACAFESDKKSALDAGASAFIAKPFSPSAVLNQVRDLTLARALQGNSSVKQ